MKNPQFLGGDTYTKKNPTQQTLIERSFFCGVATRVSIYNKVFCLVKKKKKAEMFIATLHV